MPPSPESFPDPAFQPEPSPTRRRWLTWLGLGLGGLTTGTAAVPLVATAFSPVINWTPDTWVTLGPVEQFPLNRMKIVHFKHPGRRAWDGASAYATAYVRRQPDTVVVFSVHCAHLGCPVTWFPESQLFMCPCHGGVYDSEGNVVGGPPPRGLFRYRHKIENGQLSIWAGHLPLLHAPLSPEGGQEDVAPPATE